MGAADAQVESVDGEALRLPRARQIRVHFSNAPPYIISSVSVQGISKEGKQEFKKEALNQKLSQEIKQKVKREYNERAQEKRQQFKQPPKQEFKVDMRQKFNREAIQPESKKKVTNRSAKNTIPLKKKPSRRSLSIVHDKTHKSARKSTQHVKKMPSISITHGVTQSDPKKPCIWTSFWKSLKIGGAKKVHAERSELDPLAETTNLRDPYEKSWENPTECIPRQTSSISGLRPPQNYTVFAPNSSSSSNTEARRVSNPKSSPFKPIVEVRYETTSPVWKRRVPTSGAAVVSGLGNDSPSWKRRSFAVPSTLQSNSEPLNTKTRKAVKTLPNVRHTTVYQGNKSETRQDARLESCTPLWKRRNFPQPRKLDTKAKPRGRGKFV